MRSNFFSFFMRSKFLIIDLISWSRHFSWDQNCLIMLFRVLISWSIVSCKWDHEIEIQKSIIRNFNLMTNLFVASTIMRSKFKIKYLNLVSCTCGKFLTLIISHLCIRTFNLMITLAANKLIMRSKFPNNALFWISISWSYLQLTNGPWDQN
jgi:hypothetical protein